MAAETFVWDRVVVNGLVTTGATVYWYLDYRFRGKDPWQFDVYWSYMPEGPWVKLNTEPILNNFYIDPVRRRYGTFTYSYYKVVLTDGNGYTYESPVVSEAGILDRHSYKIAKEIVRKELFLARKFTGRDGLLFKRYTIGTRCSTCADYDTDQPTKAICSTCFGTGLTGGYAAPIPLFITASGDFNNFTLRDNIDQGDEGSEVEGRVAGIVDIASGDFWVDINTDTRFMIRKVKELSSIRGVVLVASLELRQIPATSKLYDLPYDWGGGLS